MGLNEKTPLRGSEEHIPYVFMTDPNRAYKKKVRQLQCYLCSAILGIFALALLVSVAYSVDFDDDDDFDNDIINNGSLALSLHSSPPSKKNLKSEDLLTLKSSLEGSDIVNPRPVWEEGDSSAQLPRAAEIRKTTAEGLHNCNEEENLQFYCPLTKYRTADGYCNNLNHPYTWGLSMGRFKRLLQPDYCDGVSRPRCASSKQELPSPVLLGSKINTLRHWNNENNNIILSLWGQFLYQDLVSYAQYNSKGKEGSCCSSVNGTAKNCFPIEIQKEDPIFQEFNSSCLNYLRTDAVNCHPNGQREQINKATSFLDGSVLYGSTTEMENKLRKFVNGELVLYVSGNNDLLPINGDKDIECNITGRQDIHRHCTSEGLRCISENMNLPSINKMLAKQHNFIATQLSTINPHWSDERVFQEARRIVTAQIQHITYNEFLESVIGSDALKTFGDRNDKTGYYEEYDPNVDASISNAFASAAFKLVYNFLPENNHFPENNKDTHRCNLLLVSYDIHRGRDHGLPGYNKWREFCGLKKPSNFDELADVMNAESVKLLKELYQSVEDIDLYVGAFAETPIKGTSLGPVASCIINDQFKRLKSGDRFWYETSQRPQYFRRDQLAEIHKTTLSRIICDHSGAMKTIQYNIMKVSDDNPTLLCSSIPSLNLSLWDDLSSPALQSGQNTVQLNRVQDTWSSRDMMSQFMQSANSYIMKSSAKSNVSKQTTSFTVNIANITGKIGESYIIDVYNKKLPIAIPLDSVVDTSAYTPSANVLISASYEDDLLQGSFSVPLKSTDDYFIRMEKKVLEVNFVAGISIKWGGTLDINPKKKYNCKVMFQSYNKLSLPYSTEISKRETANDIKTNDDDKDIQCNILMVGTFYHRPFYCPLTPWWCLEGMIFYWSGETKLIFIKPAPPLPSPENLKKISNDNYASDIVLGKTDENIKIEKTFASVTVLKGKISGHFNGEESIDIFEGSPPVEINLDNLINPNAFDVSLQATWKATPIEDRVIVGSFSVPYYPSIGSNTDRRQFTANFTVDVIYKYGGSLGIIDPSKTYSCKVMFQANKKLSNQNEINLSGKNVTPVSIKGKTPFGESCSITVSGVFYEPSVFCKITPWWCNKQKIFHWSGDIELALKYKYNDTKKQISMENNTLIPKGSTSPLKINQATPTKSINYLGKSENVVISKTFASVTVLKGKISGQFNGEEAMEIFHGSPPIDIDLRNFVNPNSFDVSLQATWRATPSEDRIIEGTFTVPYYPTVDSNTDRRKLTANFSIDVIYKYGGSIGIIDPNKTYTCKVMFQGNKKLNSNTKEISGSVSTKTKTPFGESCSITISGVFNEPKIFHWLGDVELALKYKYNDTNTTKNTVNMANTNLKNPFILNIPVPLRSRDKVLKNENKVLGKTENVVVTKTFASVTVLKGKITGQFNGEEAIEIFNGNPPVDIYLDNLVNPNSFDVSVEATWKATPIEDRAIVGTFSVPYYPSVGSDTDRRKFTANFSVDVIYKFGGSIDIIDPSKTYTCKVMFQANKKLSSNYKLHSSIGSSMPTTIKNKTPFGESCSITISGSFHEPSVFCYFTPWWCSKEKIFHWYGDIELALKNKHNSSEDDVIENTLKKSTDSMKETFVIDDQSTIKSEGIINQYDNFCCGHRFGGKVASGWIKASTGGLFSSSKIIWSGDIPFEITLPVFWTPTNEEGTELSDVYGHAVIWTASIFHSTIQGTYSLPQYVGHGPPPSVKWISGKFFFQLEPSNISLYDLIVPGMKYNSNIHFHNQNSPDNVPFINPQRGDPTQGDVNYGIRAPIILLGKYTSDKTFVWNGTFIVDFSRTTKDFTYG